MKTPQKRKRWPYVLLVVALVPLTLVGGVYYVLARQLKHALKYAVETQTGGAYAVQSNDLRVSLWDKTVVIDRFTLTRRDTINAPVYYDVRIPRADLSIESWREVLFQQRVTVGRLSLVRPEVVVHDYRSKPPAQHHSAGAFHTSLILEGLQKTLERLRARSLTIDEGSFTLHKKRGEAPLVVRDVNLTVVNFLKIDNNDRHLFGSDRIELGLGQQRWVLSDGKNTLSFSGLRFLSTTQLFEIDSVRYEKPATPTEGALSLHADKFFFTSSHLPALYQKGELSLDTLVCIRPVLTLPLQTRKKAPVDTAATIRANVGSLFRSVTVGYVQIKDGQIRLGNPASPRTASGTDRANLNIYRLTFHPEKKPALRTDSVRLNLSNVAFYSRDSLFKIAVASFALQDDDVLFRGVSYGPASFRAPTNGLTFTAPYLHLRQIQLDELLRKRLVAAEAELLQPAIRVRAAKKSTPAQPSAPPVGGRGRKDLYQTLHTLADLLQVRRFRIVNGNAAYALTAEKPISVRLRALNATILLNQLLQSDSLVNIKQAIPTLTVGSVAATTPALRLALSRYAFDGPRQHNRVNRLRVDLPNGTTATLSGLVWEALDWDLLQKANAVELARLRLGSVVVEAKPSSTPRASGAPAQPKRPLPRLHIGEITVENVAVNAALPRQTTVGGRGKNLRVADLITRGNHVAWAGITGLLRDLTFSQPSGRQASVGSLALNSRHTSTLTNLAYADAQPGKTLRIRVPTLSVSGLFSSSDVADLHLHALTIDQPDLTIASEAGAQAGPVSPAKPFAIPLALRVDELAVRQARLNLTTRKGDATTQITTRLDVDARAVRSRKEPGGEVAFGSFQVSASDANLALPKLAVTMPTASLGLKNGKLTPTAGGKPSLTGHLLAHVTVENLNPTLPSKKGTSPGELRVGRVRGDVDLPRFAWTAGQKLAWQPWLDRASVAVTDVDFKGKSTGLTAETLTWDPRNARLRLGKFSVKPTLTKEEFMAPPHTQGDYITVQGESVVLSGVQMARWQNDSMLAVRHVALTNLVTDISRDKRMPMAAVIPEKPMPTQLIKRVKMPLRVDSVAIVNAAVTYHEVSKATNRESVVPLRALNGTLRNVTNRSRTNGDSLRLTASADLLGWRIERLRYREAYGDSLAGFHLLVKTAALNLPSLTPITNPMAAADLDDGYVEPITARIAGNQYAAVGLLRFHYRDLKVRLLSHRDTTRKTLLLNFENFMVRRVLRRRNTEDSRIFFARDRRKFVFNYWIKSLVSGILTSVGVKANKKYHASYEKTARTHILPPEE
jgi:hypothetical protein